MTSFWSISVKYFKTAEKLSFAHVARYDERKNFPVLNDNFLSISVKMLQNKQKV